ncbi:Bacterial transcription activator, effector binding domain [compost metagenome]
MEVPSELIIHHIEKSTYVQYTHVGPESALDETYDYLYQDWIPSQGYELQDYDFEVWGTAYQPESEANEIEVYIAIK